jgi:hypothetical protein
MRWLITGALLGGAILAIFVGPSLIPPQPDRTMPTPLQIPVRERAEKGRSGKPIFLIPTRCIAKITYENIHEPDRCVEWEYKRK